MAELKAVTEQIYEPDQLPIVLKTQDVMNLCRCSKPWAPMWERAKVEVHDLAGAALAVLFARKEESPLLKQAR